MLRQKNLTELITDCRGNYLIGDLAGANVVSKVLRIDPDYVPALTLKARVMLDQTSLSST